MSKLDNIFLKIIHDDQFADSIGSDANWIERIEEGKKAFNKNIRVIAEILDQLNKKIESAKIEMRLNGKSGDIIIPETEYQAIYRKVLSSLTK